MFARVTTVEIGIFISLINRMILPIAFIDKSSRMCQQMFYCHLAFRINNSTAIFSVNLHVLESRNKFGDRCAELKMSFPVEHHHGDTRNRLCHRVEAEDAVKLYWFRSGDILHTKFF